MGVIHDAVHLEEKAERIYREAAGHTEDRGAKALLGLLADAEAGHAVVLRDFSGVENLKGPDLVAAAKAWIRGAVEGGTQTLSTDSRLLDVLRRAMDLEHETETFYLHHSERATDVRVGELLGKLAKIERSHYALVSSLVEYYNRPNEWVESAEFGLRPEY
ncbi:MAG: ferritin family protein [Candidatus Bipolaricaulota bacterium]|nr:ferritin family protein [Candidatus Bipolaricaulota bacterium]